MEEDSFPKHVCLKCYQQLLDVNYFRDLIIKSDTYLKQKLTAFSPDCGEASVDLVDTVHGLTSDIASSIVADNSEFRLVKEEALNKLKPIDEKAQKDEGCCEEEELLNKAEVEILMGDCKDPPLEDPHIKNEHVRINPGRKPSKISKNKRKVCF